MMSKTVVAFALMESVDAFQAPVTRSRSVQMFSEGDIGVTRPLGVYDPLGLISTRDMRRYEVMEIKQGRAAMLGFVHVILTEAGARFPGYLSPTAGLKFSDVPSGCIASLEALPTPAWLQIMIVGCFAETGYFLFNAQDPKAAPGDIAGENWVRYSDKKTKAFKLNAERNNGRAATLRARTGCATPTRRRRRSSSTRSATTAARRHCGRELGALLRQEDEGVQAQRG